MATHCILLAATTLLLLLSLSSTPTAGDSEADLVLDIDGNPLEVGSEYYILPATAGFRGGLRRSPIGQWRCPLYIIESPFPTDLGSPVKFLPANSTHKHIHLSSDVKIDSGISAYCRDLGIWKLGINPLLRQVVIIAAGAHELPPALFKINKDVGYTISSSGVVDGDLGIFIDNFGVKLLGLTTSDKALPVSFVKKTETQAYRATN